MEESEDLSNVQAFIPINKKLQLEIDCERNEDAGTAFGFEFYIVEGENEIDGISSSCHYDDMRADITYLLNCWA